MKRMIVALIVGLLAATGAYAITVNPASNVTADSEATANTILLRDSSGNSAVNALTATTLTATAASLSVSSNTTGSIQFDFRGAYTSAQIALLTAVEGDVVFNVTTGAVCPSSATSASGPLAAAFVYPSTTSAPTVRAPCY